MKVYQHTEFVAGGCFDPNGLSTEVGAASGSGVAADNAFSHTQNNSNNPFTPSMILIDEARDDDTESKQEHHQQIDQEATPTMMAEQVQSHMAFNIEHCFNSTNVLAQNDPLDQHRNWPNAEDTTAFNLNPFHDQDQLVMDHNHLHQNFNLHALAAAAAATTGGAPTTDLLNLLQLPRLPNPCISFSNPIQKPCDFSSSLGFLGVNINPSDVDTIPHDPLFHLNLPPTQPPLFRDLMYQPFSGSHHGFGALRGSSSLFGPGSGFDEGEGSGGACQEFPLGDGNGGVFEFGRDDIGGCVGKTKDSKCPKNFVTERQRRVNLNDKYKHLKSLVPMPSKGDRASIVGDAIEYIRELNRTVNELKHLVEKKRFSKERIKRHKTEEDGGGAAGGGSGTATGTGDVESPRQGGGAVVKSEQVDQSFNGSSSALRSSWLQRKCKDTEVDVRIIDDEVTIKLVQRKKISCILLYVSRTLDELQLDLRHVAGGHCGDYYSFLFNTKIYEGSSVYASAIANRLIEVVDRQYAAAVLPTTAY